MRLDHLLSREPCFVGNNQCAGLVVGVCGCFLVPACVRHLLWVVGVGAFGLGIETKQACCRVHVQHLLGVLPMTVDARWFVWCLRLCGVLFVICIVVDEHLYCNVKPIL